MLPRSSLLDEGRAVNDIVDVDKMPDLAGEFYLAIMQRLHETLHPKTYFEIGTLNGASLAQARCAAIAVDPSFQIQADYVSKIFTKPEMHFYQMPSDAFFENYDPVTILGSRIELAFLDGMHRCEYLLRDFANTERCCKPNSIIAMHDCLPVEAAVATRIPYEITAEMPHRSGWWAGDVWRTSLLLRRRRPDLQLTVLDAHPTGLVLITNLNPDHRLLHDNYNAHVQEMLSWDFRTIGREALFDEMRVQSTSVLDRHEDVTERFWL